VSKADLDGFSNASLERRRPFPRDMKLLRHNDFQLVYKRGRRHFTANMTVFYLRRGDTQGARFGFTLPKFLGGAVERNRIKRRLREVVRLHARIVTPVDIVINPKKAALKVRFAELEKDIEGALEIIEKSA
jgi:ribonuclease P protein component